MLRSISALAMALFILSNLANAEFISDLAGVGGDVELKRNGATVNDGLLRIKNQSAEAGAAFGEGNDRVLLLKFDLSTLTQPISFASVRLEMPRGGANTFDPNESLFLYGVPDLAAGENFNEGTVTFANYPYLTGNFSVTNPRPGADLTANSVNDTLVPLLSTHTFTALTVAGQLVDLQGPGIATFLQADTNDIATFIVTVSQSNAAKTPVFNSDTGTEATQLHPTLLTNADAIVPEPSALALIALAGGCLASLRRRD